MKQNEWLPFDKKMIRFITKSLIFSTLLTILVSGITTSISMTTKSMELVIADTKVGGQRIGNSLDNYFNIVTSLMLDKNIQGYFSSNAKSLSDRGNVRNTIENICNMKSEINFISIMSDTEQLVIGQAIPHWLFQYQEKLRQEYEQGLDIGKGGMKIKATTEFKKNEQYTFNIYCPIYSSKKVGKVLGVICFNVSDPALLSMLEQKEEYFGKESYFLHKDGTIILCSNQKKIGTSMKIGRYNKFLASKKIDNWDLRFVTEISYWEILKGSIYTMVLLCILLIFMIRFLMLQSKKIVERAYEPWGQVVNAMEQVGNGNMEMCLPMNYMEPDMIVVSKGFNRMVGHIKELIEQIKEEQCQMTRIQLEALHSQIKPHFLYNTLDCIRWKAVVDGNQDVAKMIKALASYYRICLSKGQDKIPIYQEIEYLKHYLYIQKIRYEEIVNYTITVDEKFQQGYIPKLTLQPLVENAIYHGIKPKGGEGHINVVVQGREEIEIIVEDDGIGMDEEQIKEVNEQIQRYDEQFGYGIRNVNRRLKLYYGEPYGLTYFQNPKGGLTAVIKIPYINSEKKNERGEVR